MGVPVSPHHHETPIVNSIQFNPNKRTNSSPTEMADQGTFTITVRRVTTSAVSGTAVDGEEAAVLSPLAKLEIVDSSGKPSRSPIWEENGTFPASSSDPEAPKSCKPFPLTIADLTKAVQNFVKVSRPSNIFSTQSQFDSIH